MADVAAVSFSRRRRESCDRPLSGGAIAELSSKGRHGARTNRYPLLESSYQFASPRTKSEDLVSPIVWIILGVVAVIVIGGILIYNGLVQRRLRIREAFAQIEVQLKRRWDLIPNLVNAVKGYMGFEQAVLENVTQARANAVSAGAQGPAASAAAENALTGTLRSLFATVENYPELKANQNVLELQEQLTTTENQIGFARQHYNAVVLDYNTSIATIPNVLIAGPLGFRAEEFFDAEPEAAQVPRVDLSAAPNVGLPPAGTPPPMSPPPAGGTLPPGGTPPPPPPAG
jgi:LemA protein